jgi:hypothetical protein
LLGLLARARAIQQMERQEKGRRIESIINGNLTPPVTTTSAAAWTPLGPSPLKNGSGSTCATDVPVSGRVTTVVVDPTNSSKVYLGTAQGGVWRSLNGGTSWTSIFDSAQSLAIGALALAPSDPTKLYVGTGEFNGCGDCFFGVGLYRIDTVDTTPSLVGPINPSQTISNFTYNIFNGRGITKILVSPTDPATVFVATGRGVGGIGANSLGVVGGVPSLATRGLWRSTNANGAAASVTFQKLVVTTDNSPDSPPTGNVDTTDIVMEPGNPSNLLVGVIGITGTNGGIYRTTNALVGTPTFTQVLPLTTGVRISLAINKVASVVTAYAATSETPTTGCTTAANSGAVRKVVDPFGSGSWSGQLTGGGGFCRSQCFYDMPIAVDPSNANVVYIGGQTSSTCGRLVGKSIDGGSTFADDSNGLHADEHSIFFDGAGSIYTGNDGGVWKRPTIATTGTTWTNLNNAPLNTLQFEGIAVHPLDRNLMIGGTQDNGTEYQQTSGGNWRGAEGGDGGYCLIDQSATDTTNVNMYHTFFNQTGTQIAFDRAVLTTCLPNFNFWPTRGVGFGNTNDLTLSCDGTANYIQNGININDNVLFYAPMALGPGAPNTVYFGTDRLYRSTDRGDTMTVVSQAPIVSGPVSPISTIAIAPQDDNYRIVGLQNGQVWATSTGSSTMVNITSGSFPTNPNLSTNKFVGRAVIDPNNKNVAYIAFSFYAPAGQGVWKITNLGAAAALGAPPPSPIWTAAGNGIPSIPINALVIDPANSNNIFAGTDIGVYNSTDGGASWAPFGTGLPRSAVFDLALQNANRVLRAGTHGRGVWEISLAVAAPTIQFNSSSYTINEGDPNGRVNITLTRSGDTTSSASVDFVTNDDAGLTNCNVFNGIASPRCDYTNTSGTATWAAGDASAKTFSIAIIDDSYAEGNETFTVGLNNPSGSTTLGAQSTATVTIIDNDATNGPNPIDSTNFFVRQQYIDFLGREPDPPGFAGWTSTINNCAPGDTNCDRIHVSQLFFQSEEFQSRGYFVYRFYPVAFGRKPDYGEFVPDLTRVSGFLDANQLEAAKVQFITDFMARGGFACAYSSLTNQQYVDALLNNANAGISASTRQGMIDGLNNLTLTRAQVLRQIVESTEVSNKYNHQAYAVMEYFGYLRRQPDGFYLDWITVLDATNNPRGMVTGFVTSQEYRNRFGP